jgi:hypothetical protein
MFKKTESFIENKGISGPCPNISVQILNPSPIFIVACEGQKTGRRGGGITV